ncbi:hypothetical protein BK301_26535 [Escherichia coli]|nr:hypothetical protein BK301_26535 [Escherichia coli]
MLTYQRCMLTAGIFPLTVFCKNGDITNPELSGGKMPDAGRNMIHIGEEGAQKTDTSNLQGNAECAGKNFVERSWLWSAKTAEADAFV